MDIYNSILYLTPNAQFSIWYCDHDKYQGEIREDNPIQLGDVLIDWNTTNNENCPTLAQLQALNEADVTAAAETRRKQARDAAAQSNLTIQSNYQNYLLSNPNTTFSQYMDTIEALANGN